MLQASDTTVRTDVGLMRRGNEDSCYAEPPVFVLADGMGGARAGEVASQMVVDVFARGLSGQGLATERLADAVREANHEIYERSHDDAEHAGMGTTVTAAYLEDGALSLAHVGDSRAYLLRDGELSRLTEDHSLVEELMRGGKLTEEEAFEHPQRSVITRALGVEPSVEVDTWTYQLHAEDVVLLCSDGLTDMLPESQVLAAMLAEAELAKVAARLVAEANAAGGRDNITVVLFRVSDADVDVDADANAATQTGVDQPTALLSTVSPADGTAQNDPGHQLPVVGPPSRSAGRDAPAPRPLRLARLQGLRPHLPAGFVQPAERPRRSARSAKLLAGLAACAVVLALIGAGGYLASRQLYFLGTNAQGTVVVYRGFPYVLPFGIPMYETFYVSGVPASRIPRTRRGALLGHAMRDQNDAIGLINDLERGKISG